MTSQEFKEYYKKNKTVVIGVPLIILIVLVNTFILKPAREKRRLERLGANQPAAARQVASIQASVAPSDQPGHAKQPIKLPDPIRAPVYPPLSKKIDVRFQLNKTFPYPNRGRNIFLDEADKLVEIVPQTKDEVEEFYERPNLSYHGFFTLGANKVAIIKSADRLLLTKVGTVIKSTRLKLNSILPDYVVISDTSANNREFKVALSSEISSGEDEK